VTKLATDCSESWEISRVVAPNRTPYPDRLSPSRLSRVPFLVTLALPSFVSSRFRFSLSCPSQGVRVCSLAQVSIETGHLNPRAPPPEPKGVQQSNVPLERFACNHNCPLSLCEDPRVNESDHGAEQHKASRYQHESVTAGPVLPGLVAPCTVAVLTQAVERYVPRTKRRPGGGNLATSRWGGICGRQMKLARHQL
jgi:hypothetical protein